MNEIMPVLNPGEIIKSINDGRRANKRDGRDGVLISASPEYMRDHGYACQGQNKADRKWMVEWLEKHNVLKQELVSKGWLMLAPKALEALKESIDE